MAKKPAKKPTAKKTVVPSKKVATKKTETKKATTIKKSVAKKVVKKLKPAEAASKFKSLKSRYEHLLLPTENFEEEPLKEVAETKDAISKFKYDVELPGTSMPVYVPAENTNSTLDQVAEHGTTETVVVSAKMNIDPDAITFKSPGVFVVEKDEEFWQPKQLQESDEVADEDFEEPTDEEYTDAGDMNIEPSYNTNNKYGKYLLIIIVLFVSSFFLFVDSIKMQSPEPIVVDTVYKKDTTVLIQKVTDITLVDSFKDVLKKERSMNNRNIYKIDSLTIELNKYSDPIITTYK